MRLTGHEPTYFLLLRPPLTITYRQDAIDDQNLKIQQHLRDLYAQEADFDKWLDHTDAYLRELPEKNRECSLDLYAYAQNIVNYHRYLRRQQEKRQSRKILQSQWQSPFLSTRLRADPTKDRGAILRASDRPERLADQQGFLEAFSEQSGRGERLRRLEETSYSELRNQKTCKFVDEGKAKTQAERFELRATADGHRRAALQAVLRKHIHNEEQYYVGSWENNVVRLPPKPRPRLEAKLDEQKRGYYTWTNKYLRFDSCHLECAGKSRALQALVRPLYGDEPAPTDDIAFALIRKAILKENTDSSVQPEPAGQVWGFSLPDGLKPVQPENFFGPEKTIPTKGRKRKQTAGHGPSSKRPRHDSYSSEDESEYGVVPLGTGKLMPPEIRDFWITKKDAKKLIVNDKDRKEKIYAVDELPLFYLAETNYLAQIKAQQLRGLESLLEPKHGLPEAPQRGHDRKGRKIPYWANVSRIDDHPPSIFLPLPNDSVDINNWDPALPHLTARGEFPLFPRIPYFSISTQVKAG